VEKTDPRRLRRGRRRLREAVAAELADHGFDVTSYCDATALLTSLADGGDPRSSSRLGRPAMSFAASTCCPVARNGIALPVIFPDRSIVPAYEKLALRRAAPSTSSTRRAACRSWRLACGLLPTR